MIYLCWLKSIYDKQDIDMTLLCQLYVIRTCYQTYNIRNLLQSVCNCHSFVAVLSILIIYRIPHTVSLIKVVNNTLYSLTGQETNQFLVVIHLHWPPYNDCVNTSVIMTADFSHFSTSNCGSGGVAEWLTRRTSNFRIASRMG